MRVSVHYHGPLARITSRQRQKVAYYFLVTYNQPVWYNFLAAALGQTNIDACIYAMRKEGLVEEVRRRDPEFKKALSLYFKINGRQIAKDTQFIKMNEYVYKHLYAFKPFVSVLVPRRTRKYMKEYIKENMKIKK